MNDCKANAPRHHLVADLTTWEKEDIWPLDTVSCHGVLVLQAVSSGDRTYPIRYELGVYHSPTEGD